MLVYFVSWIASRRWRSQWQCFLLHTLQSRHQQRFYCTHFNSIINTAHASIPSSRAAKLRGDPVFLSFKH